MAWYSAFGTGTPVFGIRYLRYSVSGIFVLVFGIRYLVMKINQLPAFTRGELVLLVAFAVVLRFLGCAELSSAALASEEAEPGIPAMTLHHHLGRSAITNKRGDASRRISQLIQHANAFTQLIDKISPSSRARSRMSKMRTTPARLIHPSSVSFETRLRRSMSARGVQARAALAAEVNQASSLLPRTRAEMSADDARELSCNANHERLVP